MSRALVCGISGQDGTYLAQLLLEKGYSVVGTSRDAQVASFANLRRIGLLDRIALRSMVPTDFRSVLQTFLEVLPDEIYNLSGQSSVGLSFDQPVETLESVALGTLNLLEVIRLMGRPVRLYNACSGECFGDTPVGGATEVAPFRPRSPYGVAKSTSFWMVDNYRSAYKMFACSGLLFNHESPLRPARFVTSKIVGAACRIRRGDRTPLRLGNLDVHRDWGWAPEYVVAMWLMLQSQTPQDLVIATGEANSLRAFVDVAFARLGLDWREHVVIDSALCRPSDIRFSVGLPRLAEEVLGWKPVWRMTDVVAAMVDAELDRLQDAPGI